MPTASRTKAAARARRSLTPLNPGSALRDLPTNRQPDNPTPDDADGQLTRTPTT